MSKAIKKEDVAEIVAEVTKAVNAIIEALDISNTKKREEWMKKIVPSIMNVNPGYNVVVCHVPFKWNGKGLKFHIRDEVSGYWGLKHWAYDILIFKEGRFARDGDGGWVNWGYCGANVERSGDDREVLEFKASENRSLEDFEDDGIDAEEEGDAEGYGADPEEEDENAGEYDEDRSLEETEFTIEDENDGTPLALGA